MPPRKLTQGLRPQAHEVLRFMRPHLAEWPVWATGVTAGSDLCKSAERAWDSVLVQSEGSLGPVAREQPLVLATRVGKASEGEPPVARE